MLAHIFHFHIFTLILVVDPTGKDEKDKSEILEIARAVNNYINYYRIHPMNSRIFRNYESTIFLKKLSLFIYSYVLQM